MIATTLSQLDYPFLGSISPYADEADNRSLDWAHCFNLIRESDFTHADRLHYGLLAAHAYPTAQSVEQLQIAADWISWLFLMDDHVDEAGIGRDVEQLTQLHNRFVAVLQGDEPTAADWHLTHALSELRGRMLNYADTTWLRRFSRHAELYFHANCWEASNRESGLTPTLETYYVARRFTGAVYACFDLIQITDKVHLPFYVLHHPVVEEITSVANNLICWCNDILSYTKEMQQGDVHNLVLIVQHEQQVSLSDAVIQAVAIHNTETDRFMSLIDELPHFGVAIDGDLAHYVIGLQHWIRANLDWSRTALRYMSQKD